MFSPFTASSISDVRLYLQMAQESKKRTSSILFNSQIEIIQIYYFFYLTQIPGHNLVDA